MNRKKIGILVNSNNFSGIAKLSAMMANDISNQNNEVNIYIPIIPYYTYYFKVFKRPFYWVRKIATEYLKRLFFRRKFCFEHILIKQNFDLDLIKIKFFLFKISEKEISKLDCIIFNGIGDVIEYQGSNVKKKIYLINQIEEINSGYKELFQKNRKNFNGRLITHCNFMKEKLSDHINNLKVIPNPISYGIWKFKDKLKYEYPRNEILIYWKNDSIYDYTHNLLKEITTHKPEIKITIFARSLFGNTKVKQIQKLFNAKLLYDLDEHSVAQLYLNHTFLLYPNKYEDFGMPPVEALACGCIPILNHKVGAADMYAKNNFNSIHLTYNISLDASNILSKLNNNKELIKLRKNSIKNINQFDPKNYGMKILNAY